MASTDGREHTFGGSSSYSLSIPKRLLPKEGNLEDAVLRPLVTSKPAYYALVCLLLIPIGLGAYAYYTQLKEGLIVTGMRDVVVWGLYVSSFVFFIGISHAGTLISAILRVTGAEWRRPITRMAEAITVFSLMVGAPLVLIDLGRPDRLFNLILYGRIQSPILWDFISIATYFTGSIIYLYLPLIPDIAVCRDRLANVPSWRRRLYSILSLGWRGTQEQRRRLERGISIMAVLIIPIAVSVHTVVAWIFAMTLRVGWHTAIFGPYFVVGAIFSGIASIIIAMAIFRRVYHLENIITVAHFKNLGIMLLALDIALIYFTLNEYLTMGYGGMSEDIQLLNSLFGGRFLLFFWSFLIGGLIVPAFLLGHPRTRTVAGVLVAAILVDVGMWVERFLIVIPALSRPLIPADWGSYWPTWVEWSILAGALATFALLYVLFSKVFPIVSLWEVQEGLAQAEAEVEHPLPVAQVGAESVATHRPMDSARIGSGVRRAKD